MSTAVLLILLVTLLAKKLFFTRRTHSAISELAWQPRLSFYLWPSAAHSLQWSWPALDFAAIKTKSRHQQYRATPLAPNRCQCSRCKGWENISLYCVLVHFGEVFLFCEHLRTCLTLLYFRIVPFRLFTIQLFFLQVVVQAVPVQPVPVQAVQMQVQAGPKVWWLFNSVLIRIEILFDLHFFF